MSWIFLNSIHFWQLVCSSKMDSETLGPAPCSGDKAGERLVPGIYISWSGSFSSASGMLTGSANSGLVPFLVLVSDFFLWHWITRKKIRKDSFLWRYLWLRPSAFYENVFLWSLHVLPNPDLAVPGKWAGPSFYPLLYLSSPLTLAFHERSEPSTDLSTLFHPSSWQPSPF